MNVGGLFGMLMGALLVVFLMSHLLEWALFKRICETPASGIPWSVGSAVVLSIVIYGFGNAQRLIWEPFPGGLAYIVAGAIVLPLRLWSYRRRLERAEEGLTETFE